MLVIGVTGGIGSGKTTVSEYLKSKGFAYIDVDQIGRDLTADGKPLLEIIKSEFGCVKEVPRDKMLVAVEKGAVNDLVLDRGALADIVFNDSKQREKFDSIIHSEMKIVIDKQIAAYRQLESDSSPDCPEYVILDAPLLYEAKIDNRCDAVILVTSDASSRIRRVCDRDKCSPAEVQARINNQFSDEEKKARADFIIDNSGSLSDLYKQVDAILGKI